MKPVTNNPWFGPKRFGWGWGARTWQGFLIIVLLLLSVFFTAGIVSSPLRIFLIVLESLVYFTVVLLTGTKTGPKWSVSLISLIKRLFGR